MLMIANAVFNIPVNQNQNGEPPASIIEVIAYAATKITATATNILIITSALFIFFIFF